MPGAAGANEYGCSTIAHPSQMINNDVYEYRGILIAVLAARPPDPDAPARSQQPFRASLHCAEARNTRTEVAEALKASAQRHIGAVLDCIDIAGQGPMPGPVLERRKAPRSSLHV